MREKFRNKRFNQTLKIKLENGNYWQAYTMDIINRSEAIVSSYQEKGINMTLRQLYYQLVSRDIIPNDVKAYSKLSGLLTDSRYAGLIDWDAIVDRTRTSKIHSQWDNLSGLVESAIDSYRLPRWEDQKYYVELFTEKDALSSILEPIADKWHIRFNVNRGYCSASNMYSLAKRLGGKLEDGYTVILLYLGDHDPSGLDMLRDIDDRILEFLTCGNEYIDPDFSIIPIALNMEQIRQYNPPPNPAKIKDPRAKWYIGNFGNKSWEVDALRPEVMIDLVDSAIENYVDTEKMDKVIEQEKKEAELLKEFAEGLSE